MEGDGWEEGVFVRVDNGYAGAAAAVGDLALAAECLFRSEAQRLGMVWCEWVQGSPSDSREMRGSDVVEPEATLTGTELS